MSIGCFGLRTRLSIRSTNCCFASGVGGGNIKIMMCARLDTIVRQYRIWHTLGTLHPACLQPGPGPSSELQETYHVGTRGTFVNHYAIVAVMGGLSSSGVHAQSELAFLCCMIRSLMLLRTFLQRCMARKAPSHVVCCCCLLRWISPVSETHSYALSRLMH
jgi:hypothetical protein